MSIAKPIRGGGSSSVESNSENIEDEKAIENSETPKRKERSKSVKEDNSRTSPAILAMRIKHARNSGKMFSRTQSMVTAPEYEKKKNESKKKERKNSIFGFDKIKSGGELLDTHESIFKGYNVKCMCSVGNQVWVVGHGVIAVYSSKKVRLMSELKYKDPDDYVETLRFVQSGQKRNIWAGHNSGKIIIWDVKSKRQVSQISRAHKSKVTHICQVKNRVWTASEDTTVRIWDLRTQKPLDELIDNGYQAARAIAYIPETGKVWTAGDDYQIRIRDAKDGSCQSQITGFVQGICQMKKTKGLVWITGSKGSVFIFDSKKMSCIKEIRAYHVRTLALEATTEEVWSLGQDRVMKVFSIKHQRTVKNIFGTNKEIWVTSLKPVGGGSVWAHCSDGFIRVWSTLGNRTDGVILSGKRTPRKKKGKQASLNTSGKLSKSQGRKPTKNTNDRVKSSTPSSSTTTKKKRNNKLKTPSSSKKVIIDNDDSGESTESSESDEEILVSPRARREQVKRGLRKKKGKTSSSSKKTRPGGMKKKNQNSYDEDTLLDADDDYVDEIGTKKRQTKKGRKKKKSPLSSRTTKRKNENSAGKETSTKSGNRRKVPARRKSNVSQSSVGSSSSSTLQSPTQSKNKKSFSPRMLELSSPKTYEVARRLGVGKDDPVTKSSNPRPKGPAGPRTPVIQRGRGKRAGRAKTGKVRSGKKKNKVTPVTTKKSPRELKRAPYIGGLITPGGGENDEFSRDEYREEMGILRTQLTSASDRIVGFRDRLQKRKSKLRENDMMIRDMTKRYQETQDKLMELQEAGLRSSHEVTVQKKTLGEMKKEKKEFLAGLSKEMGLGRTVRSYGEILKEIRKGNLKKETLKRELQYSKQDLLSHIKHLKQIHINFKKMQKQLVTKEKLISSLNVLLSKTEKKGDQNKIETLLGSFQEMSVHTEKMRDELEERTKDNIRNSGYLDQVYDHLSIIGENLLIPPYEESIRNNKDNNNDDGDDLENNNPMMDSNDGEHLFSQPEVTQMDRIRYYLQEIQKKTLESLRGEKNSNASEVIKDMLGELREYMMKDTKND